MNIAFFSRCQRGGITLETLIVIAVALAVYIAVSDFGHAVIDGLLLAGQELVGL